MKVELSKQDLIKLLKGNSPKTIQECINNQKSGLMTFTGNQHNPSWAWSEDKLNAMSETKLLALYKTL